MEYPQADFRFSHAVVGYALLWQLFYKAVYAGSFIFVPWFKVVRSKSVTYYVKKLRLVKRGITDEKEQARLASGYFRFFFASSVVSSAHGFAMAYFLVPWAWRNSHQLVDAHIDTTFAEPAVTMACRVFTGYLLSDFVLVAPWAWRFKVPDDVMFIAHHVTLLYTWFSFANGSWGHLFAVPTMLTEVTAPLVFLRWLLNELEYTGPLFLANGVALLSTWYAFRVFGYTAFLSYRLVELRAELFTAQHLARNLPVLAFHGLGCFLQLNWGYLLTAGALKLLLPKRSPGNGEGKKSQDKVQ